METLAAVDITPFLQDPTSPESHEACKRVVEALKTTSCLIIKSPQVNEADNAAFLDLVEQYFSQKVEDLMRDVRAELSYQVGATPEFTEVPRDHTDIINSFSSLNSAHKPKGADPKWRFFWRIGERSKDTQFAELNAEPVVPERFKARWSDILNRWGNLMLSSVSVVAQMIAVGVGLPIATITDLMHQGPHLLAPTGSDLSRFGAMDTVFAGFHYDFNLLTIHGKSRFPGLFIWLRDGSRLQVKVPDGCLLLQAGKQLEWLTGGQITAGFHEVVVCDDTLRALERAREKGAPLWRISSTLFAHVNSDKTLAPLPPFSTPETLQKYPPTLAGKQAEEELQAIALQQRAN